MVKATMWLQRLLQRIFACMAKGWMADIMGQTERLGQVFIQAKRARYRAANLRDLQTVC